MRRIGGRQAVANRHFPKMADGRTGTADIDWRSDPNPAWEKTMPKPLVLSAAGLGVGLVALLLTLLDAVGEDEASLSDLTLDFLARLVLVGAAVAACLLVLRLSRLQTRTDDLALSLERAAREGEAWRAQSRRFLSGLGRAIETQFDAWRLTPAEADVAGLLLKGATIREIAALRRTSEATIRQQAQGVYRKSGLASRAELSAFFLEDLFSIGEVAMAPPPSPGEGRFDA
jgi:DNA-binding CsgD family transcriptional regulator